MPTYKHAFTVQQEHFAFVSDEVAAKGKEAIKEKLKELYDGGQTFVLNEIDEADGVWEEVEDGCPPQSFATPVLQGTWEEVKAKQLNY